MRARDAARLARAGLCSRWAALAAAGFAVSACCLCSAAAAYDAVRRETAQPCELVATLPRGTAMTGERLAALAEIPGTAAVTPALPVPAAVRFGKAEAQLTLTGIQAAYSPGQLRAGRLFPDGGAMPQIVLNEAACALLSPGGDQSDPEASRPPGAEWLNAPVTVRVGSGRGVACAVCGILAGDAEPAAFISLPAAKALLRRGGQGTEATAAWVRAENAGYAAGVAKAIAALGWDVENETEAMEERWDKELSRGGSLLFVGAFGLLCAAALLRAWQRVELAERREAWAMLPWMGMPNRTPARLFALRAAFLSLAGIAAGAAAGFVLPSFIGAAEPLPPVPPWAAAACLALWLVVAGAAAAAPGRIDAGAAA